MRNHRDTNTDHIIWHYTSIATGLSQNWNRVDSQLRTRESDIPGRICCGRCVPWKVDLVLLWEVSHLSRVSAKNLRELDLNVITVSVCG